MHPLHTIAQGSFLPANKTAEAAGLIALWTQIVLSKTTCYFITSEVRQLKAKGYVISWFSHMQV